MISNIKIITVLLAALSVGCVASSFLWPHFALQIALTVTIVATFIGLLVQMKDWKQNEVRLQKVLIEHHNLQEENQKTNERLKAAEQLLTKQVDLLRKWDSWQKNPPVLYGQEPLSKKIELLQNYLSEGSSTCDLRTFKRELMASLEAYERLKMLQLQVTIPYQQALQLQDKMIDAEIAHQNLANTIRMAMQLFDGIDGYHSPNHRDEQDLNLRVIKGEMTEDAALDESIQLDNNPNHTPIWLRSIRETMLQSGITPKDGIIYSGYKL